MVDQEHVDYESLSSGRFVSKMSVLKRSFFESHGSRHLWAHDGQGQGTVTSELMISLLLAPLTLHAL